MKTKIYLLAVTLLLANQAFAQEEESKSWELNADASFYFIPDDFFVLPVLQADKNKLHLEARYNYEDRQTLSVWAGYNFSGGKNLEFVIIPMVGGVVGGSTGLAPGLEFTLTYNRFELYSESEYLFDFESSQNNFYYNWADLTYSPTDWLWFGISGQRTRLYQTDLDLQRGIIVGGGFKSWELTGYLYNVGFGDPFFLFTLSVSF